MANVYSMQTSLHDQAGNFFQNVWHFELSEAGVATPFGYADALIDTWRTHTIASYLDLFGADVVFDFISAKKITGGGGPSAQQIVAAPGGSVQGSLSSGMAADVAWQTASGLNRPGHTYLPSMPAGSVIGSFLQNAYITLLEAWRDKMLDSLTLTGALGNAEFGIFSRSTQQFNQANIGQIKVKLTYLNKRSLPLV